MTSKLPMIEIEGGFHCEGGSVWGPQVCCLECYFQGHQRTSTAAAAHMDICNRFFVTRVSLSRGWG